MGLMTVFNIIVILPMLGQALDALRDHEDKMRTRKKE
ncbi:MAG: alanine:cation symporter family protein [Clostridiales bacterium]|nr:alanine:cation symporter family protein [Clostridiales bacterium]